MITTYLLQNCKYCTELFNYITNNPNLNICLIIVSRNDIEYIKTLEPRIQQFPIAFTGAPKINGLPYKNSHMLNGSKTILETLKNNFGTNNFKSLTNNLKKNNNYGKNSTINCKSVTHIHKKNNNCFGKSTYQAELSTKPVKTNNSNSKWGKVKKTRFTSPLGIEISF